MTEFGLFIKSQEMPPANLLSWSTTPDMVMSEARSCSLSKAHPTEASEFRDKSILWLLDKSNITDTETVFVQIVATPM